MVAVAEAIEVNPFIPTAPEPKQLQLLAATERDVLYGGEVGGGKSEALLMDAAMYVHEPEYSALVVRRSFPDLALPGALMDRAASWWQNTAARWIERDKTWKFPSGATVTFGYLDAPRDHLRYQGSAFHRIGIDESTQIREYDIRYLHSRLRRDVISRVPIGFRLASNPGGESHEYHVENFVDPLVPDPDKRFIRAGLEDNPYLDTAEYEKSLEDLDETTYRQLRGGEWIQVKGEQPFKPWWFQGKNRYTAEQTYEMWNSTVARYIGLDTANTSEETSAYSAMVVGDLQRDYRLPIRHVARERLEFPELVEWTEQEILPFARDHRLRAVFIEYAASGMQLCQTLIRNGPRWLRPLIVPVKPMQGNKFLPGKERAWKAASVWWKRGMILLPEPGEHAPWLHEFEREVFRVPNTTFKDQADGASILTNELERTEGVFTTRWLTLNAPLEASRRAPNG